MQSGRSAGSGSQGPVRSRFPHSYLRIGAVMASPIVQLIGALRAHTSSAPPRWCVMILFCAIGGRRFVRVRLH